MPKTGRGGVAWLVLNSIEYRTKVVVGYFHSILGRNNPSNPAEQAKWNQELHNLVYSSQTLKQIRVSLESTKEFFDYAD